jgi:8-oxo-dGTP diphosphatase
LLTRRPFFVAEKNHETKIGRKEKKMTDEKTIKVGLGLYILNDRGQVLLGLRKAKHGEGTWCPPGGHLKYGESFEEGAVREAFEETGIRVNPADVRVAGVTNDFFTESGKHYVTINLTTRSFAGEPRIAEPDKCAGWQWFDPDMLPENMFLPAANFLKTHRLPEC